MRLRHDLAPINARSGRCVGSYPEEPFSSLKTLVHVVHARRGPAHLGAASAAQRGLRCSPRTQRTVPLLARMTTLSVVIVPRFNRLTPLSSEPSVKPVAAKMQSPFKAAAHFRCPDRGTLRHLQPVQASRLWTRLTVGCANPVNRARHRNRTCRWCRLSTTRRGHRRGRGGRRQPRSALRRRFRSGHLQSLRAPCAARSSARGRTCRWANRAGGPARTGRR